MFRLFIFLLMTLVSIYAVKPSNKTQIWLSSVLIPLSGVILYILFSVVSNTSNISSAYIAGGEMSRCLIPAIISGLFIYFLLKKMFENNNKVKLPIALMILMGIALIGGIITKSLEYKNKKMVEKLYSEISNSDNNTSIEGYKSQETLDELNFNGMFFSYPESWKIETEVLQENLGFQISCEKSGLSSDIFTVVWLRGTDFVTTSEMVENGLNGMQEEMSKYNAKVIQSKLRNITFKGLITSSVDYNLTLLGEKIYGRCFSFLMNGNTVLITKQSDSKEKLDTEFQIIENSFYVEIPE